MNPRGSQTQNKELAAGEASAAMVSNENACKPRLFVSYRRSQLARVESVVRARWRLPASSAFSIRTPSTRWRTSRNASARASAPAASICGAV